MAKQPRVWTGTQWDTLAVTLPDLSNYSTTTQMNTAIDNAKGLVKINRLPFSATTSVDFTNAFTSTYDNYKLICEFTSASADTNIDARLLSGTTASTTGYFYALAGVNDSGGGANSVGQNIGSFPACSVVTGGTGPELSGFSCDVIAPNLAKRTRFIITQSTIASGSYVGRSGGVMHNVSSSYDGLRFLFTGTVGGVLTIYGYQK